MTQELGASDEHAVDPEDLLQLLTSGPVDLEDIMPLLRVPSSNASSNQGAQQESVPMPRAVAPALGDEEVDEQPGLLPAAAGAAPAPQAVELVGLLHQAGMSPAMAAAVAAAMAGASPQETAAVLSAQRAQQAAQQQQEALEALEAQAPQAEASAAHQEEAPPPLQPEHSDYRKCAVCMENEREMQLPCGHTLCVDCWAEWSVRNPTCPTCRAPVKQA